MPSHKIFGGSSFCLQNMRSSQFTEPQTALGNDIQEILYGTAFISLLEIHLYTGWHISGWSSKALWIESYLGQTQPEQFLDACLHTVMDPYIIHFPNNGLWDSVVYVELKILFSLFNLSSYCNISSVSSRLDNTEKQLNWSSMITDTQEY